MKTRKYSDLKDLWHCPNCDRTYPPSQHQYHLGEPDICPHCGSQGCTPYPSRQGKEEHPWNVPVTCSKCGATVPPGAQFCDGCHAQICPHCHIRMRWSCDKCGWFDEAVKHTDRGWVDRHGHTAEDVKRIKAAVARKRSKQIWEDNPEEWN